MNLINEPDRLSSFSKYAQDQVERIAKALCRKSDQSVSKWGTRIIDAQDIYLNRPNEVRDLLARFGSVRN